MSAYVKTVWVNDTAPAVNDVNLNKIEQGIYDAHVEIDTKVTIPASIAAGEVPVWNGSAFARSSVTPVGLTSIAAQPRCWVQRAAAQSVANNGAVIVNWDTEIADTDTMFAATSTDVTIKTAGVYLLVAQLAWASSATGGRAVSIRKNGAVFLTSRVTANPVAGEMTTHGISGTGVFAVNDVVTVQAYNTSGAALNVGGSDGGLGGATLLQVIRLSS